jgi:hypothetical protein
MKPITHTTSTGKKIKHSILSGHYGVYLDIPLGYL